MPDTLTAILIGTLLGISLTMIIVVATDNHVTSGNNTPPTISYIPDPDNYCAFPDAQYIANTTTTPNSLFHHCEHPVTT